MSNQLFISYASGDLEQANKIHDYLVSRNIPCWLAPNSIRAGDAWAKEIDRGINESAVLLLLWSQHAASSEWVEREIIRAQHFKLPIIPVRFDETAYSGGFAMVLNSIQPLRSTPFLTAEELLRIDRAVRSRLAHEKVAPYPLDRLPHELQETANGPPDLERHLNAIGMLMRFVALLQAAKYRHDRRYTPKLNGTVERLFTSESLFGDLEIGHVLMEELEGHDAGLFADIFEFFKAVRYEQNTARLLDVSQYRARDFDREHLDRLLDIAKHHESFAGVPMQNLDGANCNAIRQLIETIISQQWTASWRFSVLTHREGADPIEIGIQSARDLNQVDGSYAKSAVLFITTPRAKIPLDPFFTLLPVPGGKGLEIGLLRGQKKRAQFSTISSLADCPTVTRPKIVLPWGTLQITRTVPGEVFVNEAYSVGLQLENHSEDVLEVGTLSDTLSENIVSTAGGKCVTFPGPIMLGPLEKRTLEYLIRGETRGYSRYFPDNQVVSYLHRGETRQTIIGGDALITVKSLPLPGVQIKRRFFDGRGVELNGAPLPLDSRITVQATIFSQGSSIPHVKLEDLVEGGRVVEGGSCLHDGGLNRVDLQPPIHVTYQVLVTGRKQLSIRHQASDQEGRIRLTCDDRQFEIEDMPQPSLVACWRSVARIDSGGDCHHFDVKLALANNGGTTVYELRLTPNHPPRVEVTVANGEILSRHLAAGAEIVVEIKVACIGASSGELCFSIAGQTVRGEPLSQDLVLRLDQVMQWNEEALMSVGRESTIAAMEEALQLGDMVLTCVRGETGMGRMRVINLAFENLRKRAGLNAAMFAYDCTLGHGGFVAAAASLFESVVVAGQKGDEFQLLAKYYDGIELETERKIIQDFVSKNEKTGDGTWRSISLALSGLAKVRKLDRLVLVLQNISRFGRSELLDLTIWQRDLQQRLDGRIRLVVTSHVAAKELGLDAAEIVLDRLSEDECRTTIDHVFVMPRAHESLRSALIEKSERIPSYLHQLLKQLYVERERLLDFGHPRGVHILDPQTFQQLPLTVVEVELKKIELVPPEEIPPTLFGCLACLDGPINPSALRQVMVQLEEPATEDAVQRWLGLCHQKHGWLQPAGKDFILRSATLRKAFTQAASKARCDAVHEAIFQLHASGRMSCPNWFAHLAAAPVAFVQTRGEHLIKGLHELLEKGRFGEVEMTVKKLRAENLQLPPDEELELAVIDQELKWEETHSLDSAAVQVLLQQIKNHSQRRMRIALKARLCLIFSQSWSRAGDHEKAVKVAEEAEYHLGPLRFFPVRDPDLKFRHYLNAWAISYEALDEGRFERADQWLWKCLERGQKTAQGARRIASFLNLFLDFQRRYPNADARFENFPVVMVNFEGQLRPVGDNQIEARTRPERILHSFFDKALSKPDELNLTNTRELARLYYYIGLMEWQSSLPAKLAAGQASGVYDATREENVSARSYLERAEELFGTVGCLFDRALARMKLGEICLVQARLISAQLEKAQKAAPAHSSSAPRGSPADEQERISRLLEQFQADQTRGDAAMAGARHSDEKVKAVEILGKVCAAGERWFKRAAEDYESIDMPVAAVEAWECLAGILLRWCEFEAEKTEDAVGAYERLCRSAIVKAEREKANDYRRTLILLYQRAHRPGDAANLLHEMELSVDSIPEVKALIHAEALLDGFEDITSQNDEEYERDLNLLLKWRTELAGELLPEQVSASRLWVVEEARLVDALVRLACRLVTHYYLDEEAPRALQIVRLVSPGIKAVSASVPGIGAQLRQQLPELWQMAATATEAMIQDFTNLLLPLVDEGNWDETEVMLEEVWRRNTSSSAGSGRFAAAEMALILGEQAMESRNDPLRLEALAEKVLSWLASVPPAEMDPAAQLLARALTLVLQTNEKTADDQPFRTRFKHFHAALGEARPVDALLCMLIHLIERVTELHIKSRKEWYHRIVQDLSKELKPAQEGSSNRFDDITRLVQLYVQLPGRTVDAAYLLKEQCEQLLGQRNLPMLARYLSFLSDLLGTALGREGLIAGFEFLFEALAQSRETPRSENDKPTTPDLSRLTELLEEAAAGGTSEGADPEDKTILRRETGRTSKLRETALELCGKVLEKLGRENLERVKGKGVLYNAAKLLRDEDTSDLRCALHVKLHAYASESDGPSVWGTYAAWSEGVGGSSNFLRESIALISFSNAKEEDADGEVTSAGSPRNYLICAKARNKLLDDLREKEPKNEDLAIIYACLEVARLRYLDHLIENLGTLLVDLDELMKMEFVRFLYEYQIGMGENLFIRQMIFKLQGARPHLKQEMREVLERASGSVRNKMPTSEKDVLAFVTAKVEGFLLESRQRGREIMMELEKRVASFTLSQILDEVRRNLKSERRLINFNAVFGFRQPTAASTATLRRNAELELAKSILEIDPAMMLPMLLSNGLELLGENESELAERFYRRALDLAEELATDAHASRAEIFCGLMRSLFQMKRFDEAIHFGERSVSEYRALDGPLLDWSSTEKELGDLVVASGNAKGALIHYRHAIEIANRDPEKMHDTVKLQERLADVLEVASELEEARELRMAILQSLRNSHSSELLRICEAGWRQAALSDKLGRTQEADEILSGLSGMVRLEANQKAKATADAQAFLATRFLERNRDVEAEELLRSCVAWRSEALEQDHPDTAVALGTLAVAFYHLHRLEEADERARQAVKICEVRRQRVERLGVRPEEDDPPLNSLRWLALECYKAGDHARAVELLQKLIALDFEPAPNRLHIARLCLLTDRIVEARELVDAALADRDDAPTYFFPRVLWFQLVFMMLHSSDGPRDENPGMELLLGQMKAALEEDNAIETWVMEPVLEHLRSKLGAEDANLLAALTRAMSEGGNQAQLDEFPPWRRAEPRSFD